MGQDYERSPIPEGVQRIHDETLIRMDELRTAKPDKPKTYLDHATIPFNKRLQLLIEATRHERMARETEQRERGGLTQEAIDSLTEYHDLIESGVDPDSPEALEVEAGKNAFWFLLDEEERAIALRTANRLIMDKQTEEGEQ